MPNDWIPNPGSQLERALRAYFIARGATPKTDDTAHKGIHCTLDVHERKNPLRSILAHDASETAAFSGNHVFAVTIVDQFAATPQDGNADPELHRYAIDRQVGLMMNWMSQTENGADLIATAKNITDAGRALAPNTFELTKAGPPTANGVYTRQTATLWTHSSGNFYAQDNGAEWELVAVAGSAVIYTCTQADFPMRWTVEDGAAPVPKVKYDLKNSDMREFTCLNVVPDGMSRGHPTSESEGVDETTWREVRRWRITVAPTQIVGFSNTEGE